MSNYVNNIGTINSGGSSDDLDGVKIQMNNQLDTDDVE